jgi:hypothetical protein
MATKPPDPKGGDVFKKKDGTEYVVCGKGKCTETHRDNKVWCLKGADCKDDCACLLLRADQGDSKPEYKPDEDDPDGQGKRPYDPEKYWYFCACAREVKKGKG